VIAISDFVARFAEANRLIDRSRLTIIPYGVDLQSWSSIESPSDRFGIASDAFVASMTGRLVKGKGHESAIAAIRPAVAAGIDLHLLLAGEGEESSALLTAARELGVSDRVHMLGFLGDVRPVLAVSDVSLFLTESALSEGFGLAALEAMASGVPVVATRTGPLPWLVGEGGVLVGGPTDPQLDEAVVGLAQDASRIQSLREGALARAANFSIDSMVRSTIRVYEEARL
jgi:glycosyltransferase involved in cell wall biosynthesis